MKALWDITIACVAFLAGTGAMYETTRSDISDAQRDVKFIKADLKEARRMLEKSDKDFRQCLKDLNDALGPRGF